MQNEELLRTQEELAAARERYYDLFDLAPVGYLTVSEKGGILEANLAAATLLGVDRRSLLMRQFFMFIHKDDRNTFYLYVEQLFKSDSELREDPVEGGAPLSHSSGRESAQPAGCELRIIKKDGMLFWGHLAATAAQSEDGTPEYRVVLTDITRRKEAEEELLRARNNRHKAILRTSMDGFWMVNMQGRLLEVNETYCRMSGYRAEELMALSITDLESVETLGSTATDLQEIMIRGEDRFESRHRRKNGTIFDVEVSGQYRPEEGGLIVAFIRDITERKLAEEAKAALEAQFLQAQKMESIGHLAGGVAHDFNNMLSVITNYSALAAMKLEAGEPAPSIGSCLTEIRQAAERSAGITRQLLAFARKQILAPVLLDLGDTVGGMLKMLQRLIGEDIDISWQTEEGLWTVKVDPAQIDQILANLFINARDAISGVGRVTIETGNIVLGEVYCAAHGGAVPGEYVRLAVSDTGCGMEKEVQAQIFEPFFTTKGVGRGTGLGLPTVYGIVKQSNGYIEVRSEPGKGTTFTIYFPRHAAEPGEKGLEVSFLPVHGHETILLVEDEPAILESTALILEMQGYTVLMASTPDNAIRLAEEQKGEIHLLLTDVVMPEMNGQELARKLLVLYPHLKQLFMSGYSGESIANQRVLVEGVHFIEKPFSLYGLIAKVREALDSN